MVIKDTSAANCFRAAVRQILKRQKRGASKKLAQHLDVSPQYVSDMLSETTQANIPDVVKDKIADYTGMTVIDLLSIGKQFIESGSFFPYPHKVAHLAPFSKERCEFIIDLAAQDLHMDLSGFPSITTSSRHDAFIDVEQYLNGKTSDAELYEIFYNRYRRVIRYYLP